jgi:hypothetical protein
VFPGRHHERRRQGQGSQAWFEEATLPLVIVERCSVCNSVSHPWMHDTLDVALTTIDRVVHDLGLPRVDSVTVRSRHILCF